MTAPKKPAEPKRDESFWDPNTGTRVTAAPYVPKAEGDKPKS